MHCHTPNRNASLLLAIHTDTRSPEGPWWSRGGLRLGAHKSTGVPWLSGSTSSTSPTARSGPHTRKLHRPRGRTHHDIYAPGGRASIAAWLGRRGSQSRPAFLTPVNGHLREVSRGGRGAFGSAANLYLNSRESSTALAHPASGRLPGGMSKRGQGLPERTVQEGRD